MIVNNRQLTMTRGDAETIHVTLKNYELSSADRVVMSVRNVGKIDRNGNVTAGDTLIFSRTATITDGVAVIEIEPNDTKTAIDARYVYDIQLTGADGKPRTIIPISYLNLTDEVTR